MSANLVPIEILPGQLQLKPGEKKSAKVIVHNQLDQVGEYFLRVEGVPAEWAHITPNQIALFPLEETRAEIQVHPPVTASGATYHITVRAVSPSQSDVQGRALLEVQIPTPAPLNAPPPAPPPAVPNKPQSASQIEVRANPVGEGRWQLRMRNAGNVLDTFDLTVTNLASSWAQLDAPSVTLKPGEQAAVMLAVVPPSDTPARVYDFKLRTVSRLNPNERTETPLQIQVRPSAGFKLTLLPREAESQGARDFKLTLASEPNSNSDLWLELSATDPENECDFTFQQSTLLLPARQAVTTTLKVRAHSILNPNERRVLPFQVTAKPRDGSVAAQTDEARLIQVGAAPLTLAMRPQVLASDLEGIFTLSVVNPAPLETSLAFAAEDPEGSAEYTFQPAKVVLPPRAEAQIRLRVRAHAYNEDEEDKTIPFTVTATRSGDLSPAGKTDGRLVQQPIKPLTLQLVPSQQSSSGAVRYLITAINPRPTVARLSFDGLDETDALTFTFSPPEMAVSPGAEARASVQVRPKDKLMPAEQRRVHHFTVSARVQGALKPVTVSGILAQVRWGLGDTALPLMRGAVGLVQWSLVAIVLLVLINVAFAMLGELGCQSPNFRQIANLIRQNVLGTLIYQLPLSSTVQQIVHLIAKGITDLTGKPFACP